MLAGLPAALNAADAPPTDEATLTEDLKSLQDPTLLKRRVWLETEWNEFRDNTRNVEETLGGLWAWKITDHQDWAVRLKVPFESHNAGDAASDEDVQGLGDIKLATGTAFRLSDTWRAGGGVEMRFPTASNDRIGDNVWQPQLFGAVAWDATPWLTFSPSAEYNQSIAEESGVRPTQFLEMYFPATFILPHHWAVTPRYEAKVNFKDDNYWTHSAKLAVSKDLTSVPLGFMLSLKKSFDSGEKKFQLNFAVTWFL
jgi:hypothetical protein